MQHKPIRTAGTSKSRPSTAAPLERTLSNGSITSSSTSSSCSSSSLSTARSRFHPPTILPNLVTVLDTIKTTKGLLVIYFWTPWCSTCKKADPLYEHTVLSYSSAPVSFCSFDVDPEERQVETTFDLYFVPTWKFWRDGVLIETIEGDWTKFEPFLSSLIGPPTTTVPLSEEAQLIMKENREKFVEISKKLEDERLRKLLNGDNDSGSDDSEEDSASECGSEDDKCRKS